MSTAERLLNADEFYDLPEPPEGGKMELIEGRSVTMSPVGMEHGEIVHNISLGMGPFVRKATLGKVRIETGFRLRRDPDSVRAPDLSFVVAGRVPAGRRSRYFDGYPDLAVEVLSPDDRASEIAQKLSEYLAAGTARIWIIDPASRTVTVHRAGGDAHTYSDDDVLSSDDAGFNVPGFALPLADIFED